MATGVFQVKAIVPRKKIDAKRWELALIAAVEQEGQIVKRMYQKTTRTWSAPRPLFKVTSKREKLGPRGGKGGAVSTFVFTEDQKFIWVDQGTKSRDIVPRTKPYLVFKVGGKPKTKPRKIGSGAGKPGDKWVTTKRVRRHKIKARNFSDEIRKRRRRPFYKKMRTAMRKAQKRYAW